MRSTHRTMSRPAVGLLLTGALLLLAVRSAPTAFAQAATEFLPPLRDGDVHASLVAAVDRLNSSILEGPPVGAVEVWAMDAARTWLPWAGIAVAIVLLVASLALYRRRQVTDQPPQGPTSTRPGDLPAAVASALVASGPQATAVSATVLELATNGALAIEPEREGGTFSKASAQVRLLDASAVQGEVEAAVWAGLADRAEGDEVPGKELQAFATSHKQVSQVLMPGCTPRGGTTPLPRGRARVCS